MIKKILCWLGIIKYFQHEPSPNLVRLKQLTLGLDNASDQVR